VSVETLPDSSWATSIPRERIPTVLGHLASLQSALTARLLDIPGSSEPAVPEWTLTIEDLMRLTGQSRRWIFQRADELPFVKRITRKTLIGDETRLRRWIDRR
jgi:hypothetical protein